MTLAPLKRFMCVSRHGCTDFEEDLQGTLIQSRGVVKGNAFEGFDLS